MRASKQSIDTKYDPGALKKSLMGVYENKFCQDIEAVINFFLAVYNVCGDWDEEHLISGGSCASFCSCLG